jgi:hypothetical protein
LKALLGIASCASEVVRFPAPARPDRDPCFGACFGDAGFLTATAFFAGAAAAAFFAGAAAAGFFAGEAAAFSKAATARAENRRFGG